MISPFSARTERAASSRRFHSQRGVSPRGALKLRPLENLEIFLRYRRDQVQVTPRTEHMRPKCPSDVCACACFFSRLRTKPLRPAAQVSIFNGDRAVNRLNDRFSNLIKNSAFPFGHFTLRRFLCSTVHWFLDVCLLFSVRLLRGKFIFSVAYLRFVACYLIGCDELGVYGVRIRLVLNLL